MNAFQWFKGLRRDERGNALVITALSMPLFLGSAAMGVDTIQLSLWKKQLQRASDSAALAGAHAVSQGKSARVAALHDLEFNNQVPLTAAAVINNAPITGSYAGKMKAVEVILTSQRSLPFMSFFLSTPSTLTARSVASKVRLDNNCLLALHKTAANAINISGNASLALGCNIASNSNNATAARIAGSATVSATALTTVGGMDIASKIIFPDSKRFANSDVQVDPYGREGRNLQVPTEPTECSNTGVSVNSGTVTLQPGRYCGSLDIGSSANVTLAPGVHIIAGGSFDVNGGTLRGEGVTIVLVARDGVNSSMHWNGNSDIALTAPTKASGSPYAGILMMSDPASTANVTHQINGGADLALTGAMYFPTHNFTWNGNAGGRTECLQIVAATISITGNSNIPNQCKENDGVDSAHAERVRLVE